MNIKEANIFLRNRYINFKEIMNYLYLVSEKMISTRKYYTSETDIVLDVNNLFTSISDAHGYVPIEEFNKDYKHNLNEIFHVGNPVYVDTSRGIVTGKIHKKELQEMYLGDSVPGLLNKFIGCDIWIEIDDIEENDNVYIYGIEQNNLPSNEKYVVCSLDYTDCDWRGVYLKGI